MLLCYVLCRYSEETAFKNETFCLTLLIKLKRQGSFLFAREVNLPTYYQLDS